MARMLHNARLIQISVERTNDNVLVYCSTDFGAELLKPASRASRIVNEVRQRIRQQVLAGQLAHANERDKVGRRHLGLLDLHRQARAANGLVEELLEGLALDFHHCRVVGVPRRVLVDGGAHWRGA